MEVVSALLSVLGWMVELEVASALKLALDSILFLWHCTRIPSQVDTYNTLVCRYFHIQSPPAAEDKLALGYICPYNTSTTASGT